MSKRTFRHLTINDRVRVSVWSRSKCGELTVTHHGHVYHVCRRMVGVRFRGGMEIRFARVSGKQWGGNYAWLHPDDAKEET